MSSSTPPKPLPVRTQHVSPPSLSTHPRITPSIPFHPHAQLQPQPQTQSPQPHYIAPLTRRPRSDAILARGESISLARRAAATAKKRREEARAELERRGIREGMDSALAGIVAQSASTRANVSQNKSKRSKRVKWTIKEVQALQAGVRQYGEGRWAVILREFAPSFHPCRISVDLKDKWRNLFKTHRGVVQEAGAGAPSWNDPQQLQTQSPNVIHAIAAAPQEKPYIRTADLMRQNAVYAVPALDGEAAIQNNVSVEGMNGRSVGSDGTVNAEADQSRAQGQNLIQHKKETFHVQPSDSVELEETAHHDGQSIDGGQTEHHVHYEDVEVPTHQLSHEVEAQGNDHEEGAVVVEHFHQDQQSRPHEQESNASQQVHSNPANYAEDLTDQHHIAEGNEDAEAAQSNAQQQILQECQVPGRSQVDAHLATEIRDSSNGQHVDETGTAVYQEVTFCEQDEVNEEHGVHEEHLDDEDRVVHDEHAIHDGEAVHEEVDHESHIGHEASVNQAEDAAPDEQVAQENSAQGDEDIQKTYPATVGTANGVALMDTSEGDVKDSKDPPGRRPGQCNENIEDLQQPQQGRLQESVDRDHRVLKPLGNPEYDRQREVSICQQSEAKKSNCNLAGNVNQCIDSRPHDEDGVIQSSLIEQGDRNEHYHEQVMHQDNHGVDSERHIVDNEHGVHMNHVKQEDVCDQPELASEMERVAEIEDQDGVREKFEDVEIHEEHCEHENRDDTHGGNQEYYEDDEQNHDEHHQHYEEHADPHEAVGHVHYDDDGNEEHSLDPNCGEERDFETIDHDRRDENISNEDLTNDPHVAGPENTCQNQNVHDDERVLEQDEQITTENSNLKPVMGTGHPAEVSIIVDVGDCSGQNEGDSDGEYTCEAQEPNFETYESHSCQAIMADEAKTVGIELHNQGISLGDLGNEGKPSDDCGESIPQQVRETEHKRGHGKDDTCGMSSAEGNPEKMKAIDGEMKASDQSKGIDDDTKQDMNYDEGCLDDSARNGLMGQDSTVGASKLAVEKVAGQSGMKNAVGELRVGLEFCPEAMRTRKTREECSEHIVEAESSERDLGVGNGGEGVSGGRDVRTRGVKRKVEAVVGYIGENGRAERRQRIDCEAKVEAELCVEK